MIWQNFSIIFSCINNFWMWELVPFMLSVKTKKKRAVCPSDKMHLRVINSFTWIFHQIEINVYTESAKIWSQTHNTLHRSHMKPCEFTDLDLYSALCYCTLANSLIRHSPIIWQKFSRSSICKRRCHWWVFILCLKPEFMGLKFKVVLWHMVGLHVCSLFWDVVSLHSPVVTKCVLHSLEKQNCICKTKENSTFSYTDIS